nr:transcriptional regulator [Fodinicola feengrottensis]
MTGPPYEPLSWAYWMAWTLTRGQSPAVSACICGPAGPRCHPLRRGCRPLAAVGCRACVARRSPSWSASAPTTTCAWSRGGADRPSDEVLDALCRALLLGAAERAHLYDLARPPRRGATSAGRAPVLRSTLGQVVEAISTGPALIMNDRNDVLAWNRLAAILIADFPRLGVRDRNMARRIFLDPQAPRIHLDWDEAARTTVGMLRMAAGRRPQDPELVRLIGELSVQSPTFRGLWASHHVHEKTHGPKHFRHPTVGDLTLTYETFQVPGAAHHLLVVYTAAPGSPAEEALNFLSSFSPEDLSRAEP